MKLSENLAMQISGVVDKLINFWRNQKQGVSDFVLDQASEDLKKRVLIAFSQVNKAVDSGQYKDVDSQKSHQAGDEFIGGQLEEALQVLINKAVAEVLNEQLKKGK